MSLDKIGFPPPDFDELRVCDGCTKPIEADSNAALYFCDTVWLEMERHDLPEVIPQEIYCLDCYPDEIPMPHLGTNEGFSLISMREAEEEGLYSYDEIRILKGSSKNQGFEWNVLETLKQYHKTAVHDFPYTITPMYGYILFRKSGIDLRGFVIENELKIPSEEKDRVLQLLDIHLGRGYSRNYTPDAL